MASPLSSADGTPETASTLKTSAGGDAPGELATPRSPSQPASCDQRAVVATDEIDAPHLASLVEQYHGPWRKRGAGRRAALGGDVLGFKQARRAAPDPLQDPSLARARAFPVRRPPRVSERGLISSRSHLLLFLSLPPRSSRAQTRRISLTPQVYAPASDDATNGASPNASRDDPPPLASSSSDGRDDDDDDDDALDDDDASAKRRRASARPDAVARLPLMQLYDPTYKAKARSSHGVAPRSPNVVGHHPKGGGVVVPNVGVSAAFAAAMTVASSDAPIKFSIRVASIAFEAGELEIVEGTMSIVDVSQGQRRRLSEDLHFVWPPRDKSDKVEGAFTVPAKLATSGMKALIQLTHRTPAAGGFDPKIYTHKVAKQTAAHLVKEHKRLEKLDVPPGSFAHDVAPRGIVAWTVVPVIRRGGGGVDAGERVVESMFRVKEAYNEATLLEAAYSSAHALKSHKPIRCKVVVEVTPLNTREERSKAQARREMTRRPPPPALRNFAVKGSDPQWWWETTADGDGVTGDDLSGLSRDMFVYVDAVGFGKKKDARVRVQLREDDLEIESEGVPAIVRVGKPMETLAHQGSTSTPPPPFASSSATLTSPGAPAATSGELSLERSGWTPSSIGKSKGGAWCHEVRVRLPARLKPGHHLVLSVYGREPESGGMFGGAPGSSKITPETALGHAVLPLAAGPETLAADVAAAREYQYVVDDASRGDGGEKAHVSPTVNGGELALPAVKELLPKYLQANVRQHMPYWEDRKPCVNVRLRLCSNVHTSDAKLGALYAAVAAAAEADAKHAVDEQVGGGGGAPWKRFNRGSSFGGVTPAAKAAVKAAAKELGAALREVSHADGVELLRHLPAVMHVLLTLIAAPPPAVAEAMAQEAAKAAAAAAAKLAAAAARAEADARAKAAERWRAEASGSTPEFSTPAPPAHSRHSSSADERLGASASSAAGSSEDVSAIAAGSDGGASASDAPTPSPTTNLNAAAKDARASPAFSASVKSETPGTPASTTSHNTSTPDFQTPHPMKNGHGHGRGVAHSPDVETPTLPTSSLPSSLKPPSTPPTASPDASCGLRERAFASLLRVAARVQKLVPGGRGKDSRSPPLAAFVSRVFDDARCTNAWRDAACALLDKTWTDGDGDGAGDEDAGDEIAKDPKSIPTPIFPTLASLYASTLRAETSGGQRYAVVDQDAEDARAVSWFVLGLVGRSVSLDARRRYVSEPEPEPAAAASTTDDNAKDDDDAYSPRSSLDFAAAPCGPAKPSRVDERMLPLRDLADAIGAEMTASSDEKYGSVGSYLSRGLNTGFASLCSELMNVEGPPIEDDVDDAASDSSLSSTSEAAVEVAIAKTEGAWSRVGDGKHGKSSAPLAPLACELAAAHVRRLTTNAAEAGAASDVASVRSHRAALLYEFYGAVAAAPRFMSVTAATVRGTGWAWEDLASEEAAEEAADLAAAAAAEGNTAAAAAAAAMADERETERAGLDDERECLVSALAAATLSGLRSSDSNRRSGAAKALASALARHAWDARLQTTPGRAAVAAVHAPLLRLVIAHRHEILPALAPASKREVLAAVLSLARDADQAQLWTWLASDPRASEHGTVRPPPRLTAFLFLLCDALEAFEHGADALGEEEDDDAGGARGGGADGAAVDHLSTAATLATLALVQAGQAHLGWRLAALNDDAKPRKLSKTVSGSVSVFARMTRADQEKQAANDAAAKAAAVAAAAASPARVFLEGTLGVLLAAMRRPQSVTAWRAMSPLIRRLLWNHRASLLAPLIPKKKDKGAEDATPPEPFPPPPANAPGEKPYPFLEKASTCLLRTAAETLPELRAEASSCVRALLEAALDAAGSVTVLRPMLTYALCAALYSPLGAAARRGALAGELNALRLPDPGSSHAEGWETASGATVQALESAEARLRELARAATGPDASPDVESVIEMETAVAAALSWAPAAHCKALRSLSARLENGQHWVEAAEAAATAASVAMQALAAAQATAVGAPCVWNDVDAEKLRGVCGSLSRDGLAFPASPAAAATSSRCGVEEISEEKVLAHIAESVRLFVRGGHLEAATRAAKVALPAWERRRAFGDLARAHTGIAAVYRSLHQLPPAGASGSGSFGILPPPLGPPPPPATFYRVKLVGDAWGIEDRGRTWVHREPRDRTLGDMTRRLQKSLTAGLPEGTPVTPLPAGGDAPAGAACVQIQAVEPVYTVHVQSGADGDGDDDTGGGSGGGGFPAFPTTNAFIYDVPFVSGTLDAFGGSGPVAALRTQWRRRTTVNVEGRFPGLRARLQVTSEAVTEMSPASSAAEMLRSQARAIAAAADAWESTTRVAQSGGGTAAVMGGSGANAAADDAAAAAAAAGSLSALQRSLQGSLSAGVNGGVPTICEAFFPPDPKQVTWQDDGSGDDGEETRESPPRQVSSPPASPFTLKLAMSDEEREGLLEALEHFSSTCSRAVEVHGGAVRATAAEGRSSMEQMQGMFVRCLSEIKREIAAISAADSIEPAVE